MKIEVEWYTLLYFGAMLYVGACLVADATHVAAWFLAWLSSKW